MNKLKKFFVFICFGFVFISNVFSQKATVLVNGKEAFPEILNCIDKARDSIFINMFIWRDDVIGNKMAQAVLKAADRGVKVTISKDLYGSVCEHAEESATSFFHKKVSFTDKIKIITLKILYNPARTKKIRDSESELYKSILNHPNIQVEKDLFKADHSKFYIFDDEILILGGVNIEDKENGSDMSGRLYQDYMLKLEGKSVVENFKTTRKSGLNEADKEKDFYFGVNVKSDSGKIFEMEDLYLDLINSSREELTIVMAYFSPLKKFTKAILNASERGVKVTLVMPQKANFQNDSNMATALKLYKKSKGKIRIYFSPDMLHTKLMYNENTISFGSCNVTKKAFKQLDELNVFVRRESASVSDEIIKNVSQTISASKLVENKRSIKYNRFVAWLEGFLV